MRGRLRTIVFGVILAIALVVIAVGVPDELDRRPNYEHSATVPLGGAALYRILPELLEDSEVVVNVRSPYSHMRDTTLRGENYLFLTHSFNPDSLLAHTLLDYASRGNTVFVAAEEVGGAISALLGIGTERLRSPFRPATAEDSVVNLAAPGLRRLNGYQMGDAVVASGFIAVDTARAIALGVAESDAVDFVRFTIGDGEVLVSLTPRAFANYSLLTGDGAEYVAAAMSYLPARRTYWDATFKPQRTVEGSPLRFVQETPPLAWAYYSLLVGALLFVLFRGRRWQRPIPVTTPPPNRTAAFARGIARLWHERGDDSGLVERRARFLLERLRLALHDPDIDFSPVHRERIERQLGLPAGDVNALFSLILRLREARRIPPRDLLELDRLLQRFHAAL